MTNHMTMGLWTTLLVTAAAGVGGTGLGGLLATLFRRDSGREASLLLSFAAGVMVSVSCFGLLTEAAAPGAMELVALGVFLGCGVTAGLNSLLDRGRPTGGLVLAGLSPKLAAVLTTIPQCVLGGATITVFSTIAMTGMKLIASQDLTARNTTIVGLSAALGVGVSQASGALAQFPDGFTMIFGKSPVVIATLMAVLLNLILPKEKA